MQSAQVQHRCRQACGYITAVFKTADNHWQFSMHGHRARLPGILAAAQELRWAVSLAHIALAFPGVGGHLGHCQYCQPCSVNLQTSNVDTCVCTKLLTSFYVTFVYATLSLVACLQTSGEVRNTTLGPAVSSSDNQKVTFGI